MSREQKRSVTQHRVYRRHKDSKHPACIKATKRAKMEVKKARLNFEKKLADSITRSPAVARVADRTAP